MAINRRELLKTGAGSAITAVVGPLGITMAAKVEQTRPDLGWHPLTFSLIRRAEVASSGPRNVDTSQVERIIAETSAAQGCARPPVIKWLPRPFFRLHALEGLRPLRALGNGARHALEWCRVAAMRSRSIAQKHAVRPVRIRLGHRRCRGA